MKTKNINDVLKDLDALKKADVEDCVFREKALHYISELNTIKRREEKQEIMMLVIAAVVILFISVYLGITYLSNENLQQNVAEKNKIIDKYENFVNPASKEIHTVTYIDKNGKKVTIQQLLDENFKLLEKISDLEFSTAVFTNGVTVYSQVLPDYAFSYSKMNGIVDLTRVKNLGDSNLLYKFNNASCTVKLSTTLKTISSKS